MRVSVCSHSAALLGTGWIDVICCKLVDCSFLLEGTLVSARGNDSFSSWERAFLLMGTAVSSYGNARFPI